MTAGTTEITNHITYDSFGNITSEINPSDPVADPTDHLFGFTGRPFDDATGLQNNLNRWYDATIGQWLSEDPIGFEAGDANVRRYVGNEPVSRVDPSGLDDIRRVGPQKNIVRWMPECAWWWNTDDPDNAVDLGILDPSTNTVYFHPAYQLNAMDYDEVRSYGGRNTIEDVLIGLADAQGQEHYWHRMIQTIALARHANAADLMNRFGQELLITRSWEWIWDRPSKETPSGLQLDVELSFEEAADEYYKYLKAMAPAPADFARGFAGEGSGTIKQMRRDAGRPHNRESALEIQRRNRLAITMLEDLEWHLFVEMPINVAAGFLAVRAFQLPGAFDDIANASDDLRHAMHASNRAAVSGMDDVLDLADFAAQGFGRRYGRIATADEISEFRRILAREGVLLDDTASICNFAPATTGRAIMHLKPNATIYEILHEGGHVLHWKELGKNLQRWKTVGQPGRERWVLQYLLDNHWDKLNNVEHTDAWLQFMY